ncbi:MAG: hypothetical protein KDN05_06285 [Verrucomicrobiae bacterium]|nr:hypothetical protein [Verrucomicrobiae bacterium]
MKNPFLFLLFCCFVSTLHGGEGRITLADICGLYKTEKIEGERRVVTLGKRPEIEETTRRLTWTTGTEAEIGWQGRKLEVVRNTFSVVVDDGFVVQSMGFGYYPTDMAKLANLGEIKASKDVAAGQQEFIKRSQKEFLEKFTELLADFYHHMGYPHAANTEEMDKFAVITPHQDKGILTFGGVDFEIREGITLFHFVPRPDAAPDAKPFVARLVQEIVPKTMNGFHAGAAFHVEFLSEQAARHYQNVTGELQANVVQRHDPPTRPDPKLGDLRFGVVPDNDIRHFLDTVFVPDEFKSQVVVRDFFRCPGIMIGPDDLVQSIDGIMVRTGKQLREALSRPPESLGQTIKVIVLSRYHNEYTHRKEDTWALKEGELKPDFRDLDRQRELLAEQARIEEDARQSVITLHEKERARIAKEVIEFRKQAELEVLKTKEGILDLVRQKVQPALIEFTRELAREDPLWALSYLKYLAHAQPEALSPKQREKLDCIVWMNQDTRLDSYFHINLKHPDATTTALERGVSLTPINTKPCKLSVARGEMVLSNGDTYLPLDHPGVLLDFILDEGKEALDCFDALRISDCGICTLDQSHYLKSEDPSQVEKPTFSHERASLAEYQEIVTCPRDYETYKVPKPKRRTLTGLLIKGWVFATVSANVMMIGAEAMGVDTNELLDQAQRSSLEPKSPGPVRTVRMVDQWEKISTWTGRRKGHVEVHRMSNGRTVKIVQVDEDNGSFTWQVAGWFVAGETASKHRLSSQKAFRSREEVLSYIQASL